LLAQNEDTLRATLTRLRGTINLTNKAFEDAIKRFRRDRTRPTVIVQDASFDVVSVLEEHRIEFPSLIIQSAPKRIYPNGEAVGAFVGYVSEINEGELANLASVGYKAGQLVGKGGLEKQYEQQLRGREGIQFVEVDARNRIVQNGRAREDVTPQQGPPLYTNIDIDLQQYIHTVVCRHARRRGRGDGSEDRVKCWRFTVLRRSIPIGSSAACRPAYFDSLRNDPRQPLYNKAIQGQYAPGSTFKLATSVIGLEDSVITWDTHMPQSCAGFYYFGNRPGTAGGKRGTAAFSLANAIAQSCDVYFYQLGQKIGLTRLVAGGISLGFDKRAGIDLPEKSVRSSRRVFLTTSIRSSAFAGGPPARTS
jgi:penicillin-binding protein 2